MTDKAVKIIKILRKKFPNLIFEWENNLWPLGDDTPCSLIVYSGSNPSKKEGIDYKDGITHGTVNELADEFISHAVYPLKRDQS